MPPPRSSISVGVDGISSSSSSLDGSSGSESLLSTVGNIGVGSALGVTVGSSGKLSIILPIYSTRVVARSA